MQMKPYSDDEAAVSERQFLLSTCETRGSAADPAPAANATSDAENADVGGVPVDVGPSQTLRDYVWAPAPPMALSHEIFSSPIRDPVAARYTGLPGSYRLDREPIL